MKSYVYADNEDSNQTARMRLRCAHISEGTFSHVVLKFFFVNFR